MTLPTSAEPTKANVRKKAQRKAKRTTSRSGVALRQGFTISWLAAPVLTSPFVTPVPFPNPCFFSDLVTITGHVTIYSDVQPDGSLRFYSSAAGSGISTSGAKYAFSNEVHHVTVSPDDATTLRFYDYYKLIRQRDDPGTFDPVIVDPPTGTGDDFIIRVYMEVPGATGGGPNQQNSLMTITEGHCR
jgi:hypothetical protein